MIRYLIVRNFERDFMHQTGKELTKKNSRSADEEEILSALEVIIMFFDEGEEGKCEIS